MISLTTRGIINKGALKRPGISSTGMISHDFCLGQLQPIESSARVYTNTRVAVKIKISGIYPCFLAYKK